ncbi:hypothetical protein [Pedobacter frigoris]|uniref:hypothetical protein n=1 Tax=Pedobacter frigoris TaxID=2571272 RepID=UPI00292EFA62|nr:hypothetical protein [Pedobacter frigoris]
MAAKSLIPKARINDHQKALLEKHLLLKHYAFLEVSVTGNNLTCTGYCQPSKHSIIYHYKIKYSASQYPRVYAVDPEIEYDEDIHMYSSDNRFCLFYPKDFSWTTETHLFNTIVPWTHEWFLFYERYQISGKWEHPFVPHKRI